jgi:hypothetical protein
MTALKKPVKRSTVDGRTGYMVTLLPGNPALIEVRIQRRRKGYLISIPHLHTMLALREASIPMRKRGRGGRV